jgi:hypothetical protein
VIDAIKQWLSEQGMTESRQGETPDRTVLIGPEDRWISVYDEATEGQDEEKLHAVAKHLSSVTGGAAITVLVHDSDVLRMGLFENGHPIEEFDSNPTYFGGKKRKSPPVTQWYRFLVDGKEPAELRKVMQEEKLFAEDTLRRLAELMAIDADRCQLDSTTLTMKIRSMSYCAFVARFVRRASD